MPDPSFNTVSLIQKKRDGKPLSDDEIHFLIRSYTDDEIPDYQMSALLMASFLNGLNTEEAAALTDSMLHSGIIVDLNDVPGIKVDKHSTGGVGDKLSLILAPIVASCGVPVPMISGRGLGHTGGCGHDLQGVRSGSLRHQGGFRFLRQRLPDDQPRHVEVASAGSAEDHGRGRLRVHSRPVPARDGGLGQGL